VKELNVEVTTAHELTSKTQDELKVWQGNVSKLNEVNVIF